MRKKKSRYNTTITKQWEEWYSEENRESLLKKYNELCMDELNKAFEQWLDKL